MKRGFGERHGGGGPLAPGSARLSWAPERSCAPSLERYRSTKLGKGTEGDKMRSQRQGQQVTRVWPERVQALPGQRRGYGAAGPRSPPAARCSRWGPPLTRAGLWGRQRSVAVLGSRSLSCVPTAHFAVLLTWNDTQARSTQSAETASDTGRTCRSPATGPATAIVP